jgi:HPt (histidine-containing phosphotransfer) domain-containing protein
MRFIHSLWLVPGFLGSLPVRAAAAAPPACDACILPIPALEPLLPLAGGVALVFGLFFLVVHARTRHSLYLAAALGSLGTLPLLAAGSDPLLRLVPPEMRPSVQSAGLAAVFLFHLFCQHFHAFTPRLTWVLGSVHVALGAAIGAMGAWPHPELLQALHGAMLLANLAAVAGSLVLLRHGMRHQRPGAAPLLAATGALLLAGTHDLLLALGMIQSVPLMPGAAMVFVAAMLHAACSSLVDTLLESTRQAMALQGLNDSLEQRVAQRTEQLRQKSQDLRGLLQHLPLGVLTLTEGTRIDPEYSAGLETILETRDIAGRGVMDLLCAGSRAAPEAVARTEAAASSCIGQDRRHFESLAPLMLGELQKAMPDGRVKVLALDWSPLCNGQDTIDKLMLCVRDVTQLKQLEEEAGAQRRELVMVGEVAALSQEKFHDFMDGCGRLLEENRGLLAAATDRFPEVLHLLLRNMQTIKGSARTCGLAHLAQRVHESGQAYDQLRRNEGAPWQPAPLLEQLATLRAVLDDYARINHQVLGRKGPGRRGSVARYLMVEKEQVEHALQILAGVDQADPTAMRGVINQVALSLKLIGADRLDDMLVGILDALPPLAAQLGKEPPVVRIEDHGLMIRSQVHGLLKNVFTHLLHNVVDHGLESAAERLAHGKPVAGRIDLRVELAGGMLRISLRDDGRGMAIGQLRRAVLLKLLTPEQARSALAVAQTLFLPSAPMADPVTEAPGGGGGMEAVKEVLKKEEGDIEVRFLNDREADPRPFELVVTLPAKYAVQPGAQSGRRPALGASSASAP